MTMQQPSLLQKAKAAQPGFQRPDVKQFIPEGQEDAVERIVAAGMKYMFSPEMKQEVMDAIASEEPMAKKLGENVAGLILTLDQQAKGGLPVAAMFPAGMELLGEAAEIMSAGGQAVSQEDFNDAALVLMVVLARKMGADDEQIMAEASKYAGADPEEGAADMQAEQPPPAAEPMPMGGA